MAIKRDSKGRLQKGSESPNNSNQRRMIRMREYLDNKFGDNCSELFQRLDAISRGEVTTRVQKSLAAIRKRQGKDAQFDPSIAIEGSGEAMEIEVRPSIREMLDATTILLQYHAGRPTQQIDMTVDKSETKTINLEVLDNRELEAYRNTLLKLAQENPDDESIDADFKALPAETATAPTQGAKPEDENA